MKIFFVYSSHFGELLLRENCRMLINYPAARDFSKSHPDIPHGFREVLIDSGGYQLQTGVAEVSLQAYGLWLQLMLPKHPEVVGYFNLDFPNPYDTLKNQTYLESEGLKPIPVWHLGDPEEILDLYSDLYDWISIGGIASAGIMGKAGLARTINWIMSRCPNTKFHILGVGISGVLVFRQSVPYSVDFSTWSAVSRFGHAIVKDNDNWVKEIQLPKEQRDRLRVDPDFSREVTLDGIKNLIYFENEVNSHTILGRQGVIF